MAHAGHRIYGLPWPGRCGSTTAAADECAASFSADSEACDLSCSPGVVRIDQINQCLPSYHSLHLGERLLARGELLGRGYLIVLETELLPPIIPVLLCDYRFILRRRAEFSRVSLAVDIGFAINFSLTRFPPLSMCLAVVCGNVAEL